MRALLLLLMASAAALSTQTFRKSLRVFQVGFRWETDSKTEHARLSENVHKLEKQLRISLDPDCRWRKPSPDGCKNPLSDQTKEIENLAKRIEEETLGHFNIASKSKSGVKRDFDGLSQGYFIDRIKEKKNVLIDFAGDIFFSGGFMPQGRFTIAEPKTDLFTYAEVKMNSGWMIASTSPQLGATIRGTKKDPAKISHEFIRIVLFAKPKFNGARLDAWSTALIAGGTSLLDHLWDLKEYRDDWAYMFFTTEYLKTDTLPECSPNLTCSFDKETKSVQVPNW